MGLLSDPSLSPRNRIGLSLAKHMRKICLLFYVGGLIWFICLAHSDFNHQTYLSENALSPGLVYPEVRIESNALAVTLYEELLHEQKQHHTTIPHAWIESKMREFGLETYTHNFTLNYPFSKNKQYNGKNVYGILRAARVSSAEGIIFSAPYRPPGSIHDDITASVPLLLAFAEFARRKNYWAKDLIFLVTEQEQLGMHAWLEAYHNGDKQISKNGVLHFGDLPARAGALQAALNLEIQDFEFDYVDVKIEGLNGKLPNLDMFNLVQRITAREGISSGYKHSPRKRRRSTYATMEQNLNNMISMLISQATGIPTGNHGLCLRYRIEALTLEAVKRGASNTKTGRNTAAMPLLKSVEGIARSLNNLLERFHQSFFFYIIVHNDRYVSIGDYMPCLIALAASLFIKAFLTWVSLEAKQYELLENVIEILEYEDAKDLATEEEDSENTKKLIYPISNKQYIRELKKRSEYEAKTREIVEAVQIPFLRVAVYVSIVLFLGYLCNALPLYPFLLNSTLYSAVIITGTLVSINIAGILLPYILKLPQAGLEFLQVGFLLFHGVCLIIIGLLNFALGFFMGIITVPLAIALDTKAHKSVASGMIRLYTFLINPLVIIYLIMLILTFQQFPEYDYWRIILRAASATMDTATFAFMDSIIYGNWLYIVSTMIFLPIWITAWTLTSIKFETIAESTIQSHTYIKKTH